MKAVVVAFVALLPLQAFTLPDVLAVEGQEIFRLTNELRLKIGLSPMARRAPLDTSAEAKADDMASQQYFSHLNPDKRGLAFWLAGAGYRYRVAGENLAIGFPDAETVVAAWSKSPTHYANLVDTDFTEFGVGLESGTYQGQPTVYIAEHFGDPLRLTTRAASLPRSPSRSATKSLATRSGTAVQGEKIAAQDDVAPVILLGSPTPIAKYLQAKRLLNPITSIFEVARGLYLALFIFFALALSLNIFIEWRRQHYPTIARSAALLGFIAVLWWV